MDLLNDNRSKEERALDEIRIKEERERQAKETLAKYKDDDRYICLQDEDGDVGVVEKFTDEDWNRVENMIDTHPLFSKDFKDLENNELLQALQALKYDEDAETILENLYKEANQAMKDKLLGKADKKRFFIKKVMSIYSDALAQEAQCFQTRAKILSNRALLHMWLKNYGRAIEDSLEAIKLDPKFVKPYVRTCESLLKLHKYEKCIKLADKGLAVEFIKELKDIRDDAIKLHEQENAKLQEKFSQKKEADQKLLKLCEDNKLVLGGPSDYPLPQVYNVSFSLH